MHFSIRHYSNSQLLPKLRSCSLSKFDRNGEGKHPPRRALLPLGIVLASLFNGFQDDVLDGRVPGLKIQVSNDAFVFCF